VNALEYGTRLNAIRAAGQEAVSSRPTLISSIKGEVRKKYFAHGRSFSCFPARPIDSLDGCFVDARSRGALTACSGRQSLVVCVPNLMEGRKSCNHATLSFSIICGKLAASHSNGEVSLLRQFRSFPNATLWWFVCPSLL
jgi:hypothetical protein